MYNASEVCRIQVPEQQTLSKGVNYRGLNSVAHFNYYSTDYLLVGLIVKQYIRKLYCMKVQLETIYLSLFNTQHKFTMVYYKTIRTGIKLGVPSSSHVSGRAIISFYQC